MWVVYNERVTWRFACVAKATRSESSGCLVRSIEALDAYLVTRPGGQPDEPVFLVKGGAASRPASSPRPWRGPDDGSRCSYTLTSSPI